MVGEWVSRQRALACVRPLWLRGQGDEAAGRWLAWHNRTALSPSTGSVEQSAGGQAGSVWSAASLSLQHCHRASGPTDEQSAPT